MNKFLALVIVISLSFTTIFSQSIREAYKLFEENKVLEAEAMFKQLNEGETKAEALLGLGFCQAALSREDAGQKEFFEFINTTDNANMYLEGMWSYTDAELKDNAKTFYEDLLDKDGIDGKLKAKARSKLADHHKYLNNLSKAKSYYKAIGSVQPWMFVGDFENISESGFDNDYGPLKHAKNSYDFENKRGANVRWFNPGVYRMDQWVDMTYYFYSNNSIIFAQTFAESETEQDVQFRIGTSGSLKFWVNDELLFSEGKERDNGIDNYKFTGKLEAGNNRILIQIGSSEISGSNFLLRITDDNGTPLENITYAASYGEYPVKSGEASNNLIKDDVAAFFQNKIDANPKHLENYLILGQYYLNNDNVFKAKSVLKQANEHFADCSYLMYLNYLSFIRGDNENAASEVMEQIKLTDKNSPLSRGRYFDEALDNEDYDKANELIDQLVEIEGKSTSYYNHMIEVASKRNETEELVKLNREAYKKYPNDYQFIYLNYLIEKEIKKNPNGGKKVLETFLKNRYNNDAQTTLIQHYLEAGDLTKGLKLYDKLLENNPSAVGYRSRLAGLYSSIGNYDEAIKQYKQCAKIAPYVSNYYREIGKANEEKNEDELAKENYEKALYYSPYDYDSHELLRDLQGKKPIFESFEEIDELEIFKSAGGEDDYPDDNSIVLLDKVDRVVYEGGGSEARFQMIVKVLNTEGVDDWKRYNVSVGANENGEMIKAEVLKKNGGKLQAERSGGEIVFSNLEPGDGIYVSYKTETTNYGKLSKKFWDKFYMNYFFPIERSQYSLMVPKGTEFQYKLINDDLEPAVSDLNGNDIYVWQLTDLPSMKYESYMPDLSDVGKVLHISNIKDWTFVSDWYAGMAQQKSKIDFEVEQTANELFAGKENASDMDKVNIIYEYIVNNIRYRSIPFLQSGLVPQKASTVIGAKQGDCKDVSTLFVALCKTQDIDANLVLVNSRGNGALDLALPSIAFNHCIANVDVDGKEYLVELTSENLPFAASGKNDFVLQIPTERGVKSEGFIANNATRVRNKVIRNKKVTFNNNDMTIDIKSEKTGMQAASMRNTYEKEGEKERRKYMDEAIGGRYHSSKLLDLGFEDNLYDNSASVNYNYSYKVPDAFTDIGNLQIFVVPITDYVNSPDFAATEERDYGISLWEYFGSEFYQEKIQIVPPAGKQISDVPSNVVISNKYFSYSMNYQKTGSDLMVERKFEILNDDIQPQDYSTFKTDIEKVVKSDKQNLAFK